MTHSPLARKLAEEFEGFSPEVYADIGGIPTIAYGHTAGVKLGDFCSMQQAEKWLDEDMGIADGCIARLVKVELNQNQYDALCDFIFNVGCGNFAQSTLLKNLNAGQFASAASEFLRWDKVNGKSVAGLLRRRTAEKALFETPYAANPVVA